MNDNDDNLKLASADYVDSKCSGGETKSDTWYCKCLTQDMAVDFDNYSITTIPGVTAAWSWGYSETSSKQNAKIVFEKQLSITEVNKALCSFNLFGGPIFTATAYYAFAMCPIDDELEAMIPSYAVKIK